MYLVQALKTDSETLTVIDKSVRYVCVCEKLMNITPVLE